MSENTEILSDLESSARRYVEARRSSKPGASRDSKAAWREFAELGWLGAAVPESRGGYGGMAEMAVIARELGAGLVNEPYIEAGVVPTTYLAAVKPLTDHADLLNRAMTGDSVVCVALGSDHRFPDSSLTCASTAAGLKLSGSVAHVLGGGNADYLLLAIRDERNMRVVLVVDCASAGVRREVLQTIDGRDTAFVTFDDVVVARGSVWKQDSETTAAFELAVDTAIVAQAVQMIGIMDRAFDLTRSYLLARRQFGQPLAGFQALRHRLADMYAELEQARALAAAAVAALASQSTRERVRLASACKVRVIRAARLVGAQAIQLHGAIALTEEYEVGRCYTRLLTLEKTWGDLEFHTRRFAAATERQERL